MSGAPRLYLSPPHMCGRELDFVQAAFQSNWVAPAGPDIEAFEREICRYTGAPHAVALASGTAALHLALILLDVAAGDEVICPTFTFAGGAFPIAYQGATAVFVDSEPKSWNMDPDLLEQAIRDRSRRGAKPKAVIVVHLYGEPADMDPIADVCARHDVPLVEDAAESLGAFYKGQHTGTLGRFGALSFNGNKIITTSGGGMLLGPSAEEMARARVLATQAREPEPHYEHARIGYNYRMSNIAAAIGRGQLTAIRERVARRRAIFDEYVERLGTLPGIAFMPEPAYGRGNRWLTCITIDPALAGFDREALRLALEREDIESRPLWKPMHLQPVFAGCPAYTSGVTEALFTRGLCLPSGTGMTESDLERVVDCVRSLARARSVAAR
jgi:dTDP-4-amino-4,6-dideoxygalactose transaminase